MSSRMFATTFIVPPHEIMNHGEIKDERVNQSFVLTPKQSIGSHRVAGEKRPSCKGSLMRGLRSSDTTERAKREGGLSEGSREDPEYASW
ncbi:unnamed protein product [Phyllotreta striolata]|uniref:Uncharacterized protein n=1 Tax=Phyllotreta striolata TaxID=444603 RepID=A0A9N9XLV9_PHYSR|nr:unnamed protein product [Phyllotreta striolata]